jgi:vacuolar-type H+-ATPase subunit I/STV1
MSSLKADLIEALKSTEVQELLSASIVSKIESKLDPLIEKVTECQSRIQQIEESVCELTRKLHDKDKEIDEMRQYSRRNNVRIFGVPDKADQNTDKVVLEIAKKIGVDMNIEQIERSHRSGDPIHYNDRNPRPILVQFVSYRYKREFIQMRSKLKTVAPGIRIYDDLMKYRSRIAANARALLRERRIVGTWSSDGIIFVKTYDNRVLKITMQSQFDELIVSLQVKIRIKMTQNTQTSTIDDTN